MTKLASTYARSTGLLLASPDIKELFYPHPWERYITLQSGAKQQAKQYSWWQEVIAMIKPILDANKIAILHLGGKEDPQVNGVQDLRGKTTWLQSNYLIKRSLCHVGNDSFLVHCAGWNYRPICALYGSTDKGPHGPYWFDPSKTTLLSSHRMGGLPTFVMQEMPKTIDFIPPEQVANSVLRLLGIQDQFPHTTTYIGALYQHVVLELIPNVCPAPQFCPELAILVRMDMLFSEEVLVALLQTGRKVNIVTKRALNPQILAQFRAQILSYAHEIVPGVDEPPIPYTDAVRSMFPTNHVFFTRERDEKKVADLRFTYFDHVVINTQYDVTKEEYLTSALVYLNRPNTPENRLDLSNQIAQNKVRFKTNKYILSSTSIFLSHAHVAANQPIGAMTDNVGQVIDDQLFWKDQQHLLFTYHP